MSLVKINLNMDVMYFDIDNRYKQFDEADLNVNATDLVIDLNCCPNPRMDLNNEPYLEEDGTHMKIGSLQKTNYNIGIVCVYIYIYIYIYIYMI